LAFHLALTTLVGAISYSILAFFILPISIAKIKGRWIKSEDKEVEIVN